MSAIKIVYAYTPGPEGQDKNKVDVLLQGGNCGKFFKFYFIFANFARSKNEKKYFMVNELRG